MFNFRQINEFDWDEGNIDKNQAKHNVSKRECEEVFVNPPFLQHPDREHSLVEKRFYVLGKTSQARHLFLAITIRDDKIRVISARDMSKKERNIYEEETKNNPKIQE